MEIAVDLENLALRVIEGYRRRLYKKLKRRNPLDRLKSRQYYKKHKNRILLQRRRYQHRTSPFKKTKKMFKRAVPSWMKSLKHPHPVKPKGPKKRPSYKPKKLRTILKRPLKKLFKAITHKPSYKRKRD